MKKPFEEILKKHNYCLFSNSKEKNPVTLIADIHSSKIEQRNEKLLQDILTKDDVLFMESTPSGIIYPNLHPLFFEDAKISLEAQEQIKELYAKRSKFLKKSKKSVFPCEIYGSDDDLIYLSCIIAKNSINANTSRLDGDEVKQLGFQKTLTDVLRVNAIYLDIIISATLYRNIAMAQTIKNRQKQMPNVNIYQVIGAQHVLSKQELASQGISLDYPLSKTAGQLNEMLTEEGINYVVIGPKNLREEYISAKNMPA